MRKDADGVNAGIASAFAGSLTQATVKAWVSQGYEMTEQMP